MTRLLFHVVLDGDRRERNEQKSNQQRENTQRQEADRVYSLLLMTFGEVISTYSCVIRHFRSNTDILYSQT